jgi:23S rRNA (uracil1939-C5)-methyltransferase
MTSTIDHLNWRAEGVCGDKLFRKVLPGEVVESGTGRVLTASPDRIAAFCPHFDRCGGCQLQMWQSAPYAQWKSALVSAALKRRGIPANPPCLIPAHGAGRRRVAIHVRRKEGEVRAGFMAARSHDLVDIDRCPVLVPALDRAMEIARAIGQRVGDGDVWVTAADNGLDVAVKAERKIADEQMPKLAALVGSLALLRLSVNGQVVGLTQRPQLVVGKALVQLPPASFLQATQQGEEVLATLVVEGVGKAKSVADLFCGIGPFALRLAQTAKVQALDSDGAAIASLAQAVRLTPGLKPLAAAVRDLMREPLVANELKEFDAVVFDPPRAGAEAQARQLARSTVKTVVAVSCDPPSFARDAEILLAGGFKLKGLVVVDQFMWTSHVETVGVFRR